MTVRNNHADEAYALAEVVTALLFADDFASEEHSSRSSIQVSRESPRFVVTIKLERKKEEGVKEPVPWGTRDPNLPVRKK